MGHKATGLSVRYVLAVCVELHGVTAIKESPLGYPDRWLVIFRSVEPVLSPDVHFSPLSFHALSITMHPRFRIRHDVDGFSPHRAGIQGGGFVLKGGLR